MFDKIFSFLDERGIYYEKNAPIKKYSSIKIGGIAQLIAFPDDIENIIAIIEFFSNNGIVHKIVGRMTNLLPCDELCTVALINTTGFCNYTVDNNRVACGCGTLFSRALQKIAAVGLGGAEALASIPGTVGGMLYSNAGAFGTEISDFFVRAVVYDKKMKCKQILYKDDMNFGYRTSVLKDNNFIVLSADFDFFQKDTVRILDDMRYFREMRLKSQPIEYPSLGSVFKKSHGISAGELLDKCGLKGTRIGGAAISSKHAGFIINESGATANDVRALIKLAEEAVFNKFGIRLEREIEYL